MVVRHSGGGRGIQQHGDNDEVELLHDGPDCFGKLYRVNIKIKDDTDTKTQMAEKE